jgi:DNA-binding LytR/AlgR family response regulator
MLSRQKLLIIEDVFLIALEIQRILESANAEETVFARDFVEAQLLADRFHEFDLAIVNPPPDRSPEIETAGLLAKAGPAIVVCTAAKIDLATSPLAGAELIIKPFADEDLLASCQRARDKRAG